MIESQQEVFDKSIGRLIRRTRRDKDLSQEKLAEQVGISRPYLSDIERGKLYPAVEILYKIAAQLGITITIDPPKTG